MNINLKDIGLLRVAAVSPEIKLGDVEYNLNKTKEIIEKHKDKFIDVMLFPEMSLTGYTIGDMVFNQDILHKSKNALITLKEYSQDKTSIIIVGLPLVNSNKLYNCAAVLHKGVILGIVVKTYLCNTSEYYEERWFTSADNNLNDTIFLDEHIPFGNDLLFKSSSIENLQFGVEICEDLWAPIPPSVDLALSGANVIFNLSASNEVLHKRKHRRALVTNHSARIKSSYIYTSASVFESSTDLLYSAHILIAENGKLISEDSKIEFNDKIEIADIEFELTASEKLKSNSFTKSFPSKEIRQIYFEIDSNSVSEILRPLHYLPFVPHIDSLLKQTIEDVFEIQYMALAKRLKFLNCYNVILGISGGLDSTLALLVCVKAFEILNLDKKNVIAVSMPGFGTSQNTKSNAEILAESLSVTYREIDIKNAVNQHFKDISHDVNKFDIVYENSQARERTQILMDIANQVSGIVVGTGDLSELALGWCTYNADQISMYGVNAGVPKTLIQEMINYFAGSIEYSNIKEVLKAIYNAPISPELLPLNEKGETVQDTEASIGSYKLHDFFIYYFVRYGFSDTKILTYAHIAFKGIFTSEEIEKTYSIFKHRFFSQQYKRNLMPDGIKVGTVALSPRGDWRMPSDMYKS